ncbi:hypothetical protein QN277_010561 [Acacia crassicarpa]|uniref:Uncharacterized protein n=1 Tax=Acacia crassicarpa TaxID=499986 RepID=A0AAE1IN38_9FABA|nr:hypothetical protein QN277_010561 [Acacia crassicarpa]
MLSEITEEIDEDQINIQVQKDKIRKIIQHQKSLHYSSSISSSSSSSLAASCSSPSSSSRRNLLELMKGGSTSLRRLFEMEHTSLATHFEYYSGSPLIKPIPLWGSESEGEYEDPWAMIKTMHNTQFHNQSDNYDRESGLASKGSDFGNGFIGNNYKRRLTRKISFRRLPELGTWICGRFRFRIRLRRRFKLLIYCNKLRRKLQNLL